MPEGQVSLTDDELAAAQKSGLFADPAVVNRLDSDSRRRLQRYRGPATPDSPTAGASAPVRFMGGVAQALDPTPFVKSLTTQGPVQTGQNMLAAQGQQFQQAGQDISKGRYTEAVGHGLAGALPVLGPAAAHAGETIAAGDVAGGLGQAVGLTAPFVAGPAMEGARQAADVTGLGERIAGAAERGATDRFVNATAPKVGQNKLRLNNMAADVAPDVLRQTTANTRSGLQQQVESKLEDAKAGLDSAADARGSNASMPTRPVLEALRAARQRLVAESIKGSPLEPGASGTDVVPTPNQEQVALIDKAIADVTQLGPTARYEALRRIRQSYDQIARVKYSPAVTPDFLAKQGEASAAESVAGALREGLGTKSPETAKANADYSLWKSATDVLKATEETERARPTVGRTIMARGLGAAAGGAEGGVVGAGVGAVIGPLIERLLSETRPAVKIMTARRLSELADALRQGPPARVQSLTQKLVAQAPTAVMATPKGSNVVPLPMAAENHTDQPPE